MLHRVTLLCLQQPLQVDFIRLLREDWKVWETWKELKSHCVNGTMNKTDVVKKCSEEGISPGTLMSSPNILWKLYSFEVAEQLMIDEFHNMGEGHANIFQSLFEGFTPEAEKVIEAVWSDPNVWDPLKGGMSSHSVYLVLS